MLERRFCPFVPLGQPRDSYPLLLFLPLWPTLGDYEMTELTPSRGFSDFLSTYSKTYTVSHSLWGSTWPDPWLTLWFGACHIPTSYSFFSLSDCSTASWIYQTYSHLWAFALSVPPARTLIPHTSSCSFNSSVTSSERPFWLSIKCEPTHSKACLHHLWFSSLYLPLKLFTFLFSVCFRCPLILEWDACAEFQHQHFLW